MSVDTKDLCARYGQYFPTPVGHHILVLILEASEKTRGGIIKPDALRDRETFGNDVAVVLKMGPEAYKSKEHFPSGPWCKEGDTVAVPRYGGTRHEPEFDGKRLLMRILNDNSVMAVFENSEYAMEGR